MLDPQSSGKGANDLGSEALLTDYLIKLGQPILDFLVGYLVVLSAVFLDLVDLLVKSLIGLALVEEDGLVFAGYFFILVKDGASLRY
jgi:hypothetical protein